MDRARSFEYCGHVCTSIWPWSGRRETHLSRRASSFATPIWTVQTPDMVGRVDFAAGKPIRGDLGEGKLVEDLQPMQGPFRDGLPLLTPLMDI